MTGHHRGFIPDAQDIVSSQNVTQGRMVIDSADGILMELERNFEGRMGCSTIMKKNGCYSR